MANRKKAPKNAEQIEMEKWGVPDWRDKNAYPVWDELSKDQQHWDDLPPDRQKWEFLRRNEGYRWLCDQATTPEDQQVIAERFGLTNFTPPQLNQKDLPDTFAFKRSVSETRSGYVVAPLPPPPLSKKKASEGEWDTILAKRAAIIRKRHLDLVPDWYDLRVWVEFDLEGDMEEQWVNAKDQIRKVRDEAKAFMRRLENKSGLYEADDYAPREVAGKKPKTITRDQAIHLLRLYDAKNCGRTYGEIESYLSNDERHTDKGRSESSLRESFEFAKRVWRQL